MLKACLVKDYRSLFRKPSSYIILIVPVVTAILGIISCILMSVLSNATLNELENQSIAGLVEESIKLSYADGLQMFSSNMTSYGLIVALFVFSTCYTREIKRNQWVIPISAGIRPQDMFISKLIVNSILFIVSIVIGCFINFVFVIAYCEPQGLSIGMMFYTYFTIILYNFMVCVILMSLNYLTKRSYIGIISVVLLSFVLSIVLNIIKIGDGYLGDYTPLSWFSGIVKYEFESPLKVALQYVIFAIITIGLIVMGYTKKTVKSSK